jgi:hypothetical protein
MDRKTKWRKLTALGFVHLAGGWVRKPAAETLQPLPWLTRRMMWSRPQTKPVPGGPPA